MISIYRICTKQAMTPMTTTRATVNDQGELVIAGDTLKLADINPGTTVFVKVLGTGHIEVVSYDASVGAARKIIADAGVDLSGVVDELLAERRREAESE